MDHAEPRQSSLQAAAPAPGRLSVERIAKAITAIDPEFRDSPQFEPASIGQLFGCRLVVKIETLNPIRSFKARGAQFLIEQLSGRPHLVCVTAGNFGQGMACAARKHNLSITVFTNIDANPLKIERMRALGADVRTVGADLDEAHDAAKRFAAETGAMMIEDGRDVAIAEGAGTIGLELLRWREPFDAVLVPVGDGALIGGIGCWIKAHRPTTRIIGVCPARSPAMERSWRNRAVTKASSATIADGLSVQTPFAEAVTDLVALVDDMLLVEDALMIEAMRLAHRDLGLVLEPSGAAGLAALLTHRERFQGQLVATVLTGGNLTTEQMRQWLG